jgi:hypothetical protein
LNEDTFKKIQEKRRTGTPQYLVGTQSLKKSCEIRVQNAGKAVKEVHYNYQDRAQVTETSTLHEL